MTIADVLRLLEQLPDTAQVPVGWVRAQLQDADAPTSSAAPDPAAAPATWREKLWTCDANVRLGVEELAEALGRSRSWIHHRTGNAASVRIPHARHDNALVFKAGEIRQWLAQHEEIVARPTTPVLPITRGRNAAR